MIHFSEYFRSVEHIWVIWLISLVSLVLLIRRLLKKWKRGSVRKIIACESGATYSISYVIAFPIFMLLIFAVIQSTMILLVKMGTVYASYAATRSAVVWLEAEPRQLGWLRVRQAAVNAMTPFGSSSNTHAEWMSLDSTNQSANTYFQAYRKYSQGGATSKYITRKYMCAERCTTVRLEGSSWIPKENEPLTLKLTYRMPLHIPWFARLIGRGDGYLPIDTVVTLPFEGATDAELQRQRSGHPMGIPYYSF